MGGFPSRNRGLLGTDADDQFTVSLSNNQIHWERGLSARKRCGISHLRGYNKLEVSSSNRPRLWCCLHPKRQKSNFVRLNEPSTSNTDCNDVVNGQNKPANLSVSSLRRFFQRNILHASKQHKKTNNWIPCVPTSSSLTRLTTSNSCYVNLGFADSPMTVLEKQEDANSRLNSGLSEIGELRTYLEDLSKLLRSDACITSVPSNSISTQTAPTEEIHSWEGTEANLTRSSSLSPDRQVNQLKRLLEEKEATIQKCKQENMRLEEAIENLCSAIRRREIDHTRFVNFLKTTNHVELALINQTEQHPMPSRMLNNGHEWGANCHLSEPDILPAQAKIKVAHGSDNCLFGGYAYEHPSSHIRTANMEGPQRLTANQKSYYSIRSHSQQQLTTHRQQPHHHFPQLQQHQQQQQQQYNRNHFAYKMRPLQKQNLRDAFPPAKPRFAVAALSTSEV